jgi:PAS domain S-box-containing protein
MFISTSAFTPIELTAAIIREPLVVSPDTTVKAAIAQMSGVRSLCHVNKTADEQLEQLHLEVRSSCVLVVAAGKLIGILTERDIVRLSAERQPLDHLPIQQVMAHPIVTLRESDFTDLFSAINLLQQHHIRHLPIVDDTIHLVGIVTHESLRQIFRPIDLLRLRLAAEAMTREVICATADRPILEIVQLMAQNRVSSVIVVETRDQPEPLPIPVGMITERDIVQFQALGLNLESCQAEAVMSTPIFTIKPEDSLAGVQELMNQHLIGRLAVTGKQGELLGIVTQTSLLQALNPLELYKLAETLAAKVVKLKADQIALLDNHNIDLEKQVESRTTALQAKAQQQKLIADIATQIRSSLSLQTILDTAVKEVRQVLECTRVNIWQLTADGQITVVAESTNSSRSLLGEKLKDLCFSQKDCIEIYRQGHIHVLPDIYTTKISDCHRQMLIRLETRAKILVPIICDDQLWGLLNASESQYPRDWQQLEIELLQLLSIQVAIAIQQATTHQKLQDELAIRKRIETTLKESEERYAALAAAAPVGIFCTDTRGQCIYINDRYSQITGLTAALARNQGWEQRLHPEDRDWVLAKWENFVKNQAPFELEYRFQSPDGKVTWVYGQSVPERDGFGQLIGYVGTITDISDRKRTESALQQSEERYVTLVEAAPVGIFRTDVLGNCIYVNDHWCLMSGLTPKSALGSGWRTGLHPDDRDAIATEWYESAQENRPFQLEYRFQRPDGKVTWVYGQSVSELNGEGQIVGYVGTVTDISDRKQAERMLQELNQKLENKVKERTQQLSQVNSLQRAILDGADYSIISCSPDGIIETFNAAATRMLGYQATEMIGKVTPAILHDAQEVIARANLLSAELGREIPPGFEVFVAQARQGIISETEWTYIRKDGSKFPISLSVTALKDPHQQIIGFLGIAKDITERKRAEAELKKVSERLALSLKSAEIGCWEWDILNNIIIWDDRMYELHGVTPKSDFHLLYDIWINGLHPDDRAYTKTLIQEAILGKVEYDSEFRVIHPDGSIHFIKAYGVVARDAQGDPQSMIGINFDISDRKQAEIELQKVIQELSAFKLALDQSAIVAITNSQGVITYVNDRFCEISGYSRNELLGQTHHLVNSNYHSSEFFQELWQTIARGEIWRGEVCNRTKNNHRYWVQSTIVPFLDAQGLPFQYLAIRFDITDRKLAEAAIQQENAFRRQIVENMTEGLCVFHAVDEFPLLHFTVWNQQMQEITGYSLKEISRLGWYQSLLTELEVQAQAIARMTRMQQGENLMAEEWEIQRQDGQRRTVSISTSILSVNDERIYTLALIQDITERKHTELENLLLKERLEFLLSSSPAMIYSCKPFGDYAATFMSQNIEAILGYKPEQFLSESGFWTKHIHPDDTSRIFSELSHLFEKNTHQHEYRFLHRDGYYVWIRDELRLVRDQEGNPVEIVGYFADISERKKIEQIIKKQNEELARATRLKDEFLANMSHELRTPLNAILGMTEGLQDQVFGLINEEQLKALQTIEKSGSHLLALINDILDIAKIESGQIKLDLNPVSIDSLCQSSLTFIKQQALQKRIEIEIKQSLNLPDLLIDERRIRQVLINLLNNAVKFTPNEGKITLEVSHQRGNGQVEAEALSSQNYVQIAVIDTGIGISPENIKKLFQPFIQIDSDLNRQYQGTGLGLALVKRIVELHRGQVELTSEVGHGSCFTIKLPCITTVSISPELTESSLSTRSTNQSNQSSSPLILLAEDNEANVITVSSYLGAKGYRILNAKNGQEAIEFAKLHQPNLILMDIQMPGMDGLEAMREIRRDPQLVDVPIIALTALAMTGDRERCLQAGANDYLTKPVKLKQLTANIQKLLGA